MNKSGRIQILVAAAFGLTAVVLGALGAHALEAALAERGTTGAWETAALYHLAHALALFVLGTWSAGDGGTSLRCWTAACWIGGILLFSGSLYVLALGGPRFLGPVTPLGGLLFILGWIGVMVEAWKSKRNCPGKAGGREA